MYIYVVSQAGYSKKYGIQSGPVWATTSEEEAERNFQTVLKTVRDVEKAHGGKKDPVQGIVPLASMYGQDATCKYSSGEESVVSLRRCWVDHE